MLQKLWNTFVGYTLINFIIKNISNLEIIYLVK